MAEFVVSSVVKRLGDLLIQEGKFLHGVSGKVELMQIELKLIQSYLEDADKRQDENKTVQTWISEIREAAYDAEDAIDTFALKIASRRREGIQNAFKRYACIIGEATEIHEDGSQIEAITAKISTLTNRLETYGIIKHTREGEASSSAHERQRLWRQSYSHDVEEYTVGLGRDIEILAEQLVNEEKHCDVVSIWGMGGLGKTTLAKKAYHHSKIRRHFDAFAWVYVSQQTQQKEVWEGILFELISASKDTREEIRGWRNEKLAENLFQVQRDKKCLVILDDIWTTEAWDSLKFAFPVQKSCSKLLLTTRNEKLAQHVDPNAFNHELKLLNEEESWELFKKKAFPREDDPGFKYEARETLGKEMIRRCGGLPLAIVVLGGLLAAKHTWNEWNKVNENIKLHLVRGKDHEQYDSGEISKVLALSYHELPYQLKPCFLHLAHFPEDFDIPIEKLFRMWVAEGIVSPMQYDVEGEKTLEDVAECYLHELMHRCMVQVGKKGFTGRVETCRLHDLMRDLCVSKAEQENYLKIVPLQDGNEQMVTIANSNSKIHRLAIYLPKKNSNSNSKFLNFSWERERISHLRSLLFLGPDVKIILREMPFKFNGIKLLKTLDLEGFLFKGKLLRAIGNLIHLRYLSLYLSKPMKLPSSIGNLRCLQTLIITSYGHTIKIPNVIWKMERLRHLYLPHPLRNWGKLRMDNLKDLQTLRGFDAKRCHVKELIKFTNLKDLEIWNLKSFKELEGILMRSQSVTFNRLRSLSISVSDSALEETDLQALRSGCPHLSTLGLGGPIMKLPEYPQFPSKLAQLTLAYSDLLEDPMPTLEKLPYLTILRLRYESFNGKEMVCSSKGFPQLKSLHLSCLPNLEEWRVDEEAMPTLCELEIHWCRNLKMVPDGLRFITTLRELRIKDMPEEFANRLRVVNEVEGEDLFKVQHVPSIIIQSVPDLLDQFQGVLDISCK